MTKTTATIYFIAFLILGITSCRQTASNIKVVEKQIQVPILKNKTENPAFALKLDNQQGQQVTVESINLNLEGTDDLNGIKSIKIFYTGKDSVLTDIEKYQLFGEAASPKKEMVFTGNVKLPASPVFFIVSVQLTENAKLHDKIQINCTKVEYGDNTYSTPAANHDLATKHRIGIALRQHNDDMVHTYRIPGLTTTNQGTLLAIYDARHNSSRDLQGDIDIGVSRSTDGGKTWEPMLIGLDMGKWGNLPEKFNGVSDPCILVDKNSNKIFLAGLWMYGVLDENGKWTENLDENSDDWNHQWRDKGSQPGFEPKQTAQFLIATSTDDGKTWDNPENITKMCKKEEWWLWAPAPGHGITLNDGTLVFPTQGRDKNGMSFSNITFSKDGGETWETSPPAYSNTTENMVAQLSGGSIMLNARYNPNRKNQTNTNGRVVVTTKNLGETWEEHPSSRSALIESTCMAALHKHVYHENGEEKSILLFSNPNTKTGRHHITLKVSFDDGETWPEKYWMLLDEGKCRGYSCITSINEGTIGILYEGSQSDLTFESILLSELLNK